MKSFIFNSAKCNGCRNCQIVCKDEHCDNKWLPYALPQPDTGQFWLEVEDRERGSVPKVHVDYVVHMCQHCADEAPCMKAAVDAGKPDAVYRRDDGLVIVDPVASEGLNLVGSCPFGALYFNDELQVSQKCTGCAHLLDDGWSVPRCVDACPHGALTYGAVDEHPVSDSFEELMPDADCRPTMKYLNLPKRFIAGLVVDPVADEVIIGAKVILQNTDSGNVIATETDDFGDFWFKQIDTANYTLYFEAGGYLTRTAEACTIEEDKNIGQIDMFVTPVEG